jgi:3',5'-cyclic AMP phosphodiesterase CpdA
MCLIAHISDLHFGRERDEVVVGLLADLRALDPDIVVVSGDLTQRARRRQFEAARAFLDGLPGHVVVVPGNHDIPLFDLARRLLDPLGRYRRHISDDLCPFYVNDEIAMLGLTTARRTTWKEGRISAAQTEVIRKRLCGASGSAFKALVTHHPFTPPPTLPRAAVVGGGAEALVTALDCGVDIVLAGHMHAGYAVDVRTIYATLPRSVLSIQAGTAVSERLRGAGDSYNLIRAEPPVLELHVRSWQGDGYETTTEGRYRKSDGGWLVEESPA